MKEQWIATEAIVTTCVYQSRGLSTLAFGFQTGEKFRITFDYYAHGQTYSGEFQSAVAIPQNERIPISYNPLDPAQNDRAPISDPDGRSMRSPRILIGIAGSIVLSLAWLAILRGCRP